MHHVVTRRPSNQQELKTDAKSSGSKPADNQRDFRKDVRTGEPSASPMFAREDWTLFRTLETLGQKAGVTVDVLPKLVAKELVDNSCDAAGTCRASLLPNGGLRVEDQGGGIPGSAEALGKLFSIRRELVSSKVVRLPTRGALGNGLRVVAGAVLSTAGNMSLCTRGKEYSLRFDDDGTTTATCIGKCSVRGTRIDIWLGDGPWPTGGFDDEALEWARTAIMFSAAKSAYKGRTSAYWYSSASFFELLQAAGSRMVRDLVSTFEGCSGGKAGIVAADYLGRACSALSRIEADHLLGKLRDHSSPVKPPRLGQVGHIPGLPAAHAVVTGTFDADTSGGQHTAELPYVVEAWAKPSAFPEVHLSVNRTPSTAEVRAHHEKTDLQLFGCGLRNAVKIGRGHVELWVNIQSPHMPITTDGKAPDVTPMLDAVLDTIRKAAKKVNRSRSTLAQRTTEKDIIIANLSEAVALASGGGDSVYSLRQLYYKMRPLVGTVMEKELSYGNFTKVIGECEGEQGALPGLYRDARGVLYHPHIGQEIPLGTLAVNAYTRPAFTFNKILYAEKEGFFPILRQARWPERHDCALLTSKGFASRAARDILDLLGESDEELLVFCIHDADAAGSMIYQALQGATAARGARSVKVINLGLEPWEALEMGLEVENIETADSERRRRQAVANYVKDRRDGSKWKGWLQRHRVELNAMGTPEFIAWLDGKMEEHGNGRLVPTAAVMTERLSQETRALVEKNVKADLLAKHGFVDKVAATMAKLSADIGRDARRMGTAVREALAQPEHEHRSWADIVTAGAARIAARRKQRST